MSDSKKEAQNTTNQLIVGISFDATINLYKVTIPTGMSLNEVMFGVNVMIRCWVRDGIIKDTKEAIDLLNKYLTDPQFNEVTNETDRS